MAGTIKKSTYMNVAAENALKNTLLIDSEITEKIKEKAKKEKSSDIQTVNFNMNKTMYEELKKLFGGAGYSFAQGARMTFDYILSEIEDGNIELRESGFRKTVSSRLR